MFLLQVDDADRLQSIRSSSPGIALDGMKLILKFECGVEWAHLFLPSFHLILLFLDFYLDILINPIFSKYPLGSIYIDIGVQFVHQK